MTKPVRNLPPLATVTELIDLTQLVKVNSINLLILTNYQLTRFRIYITYYRECFVGIDFGKRIYTILNLKVQTVYNVRNYKQL